MESGLATFWTAATITRNKKMSSVGHLLLSSVIVALTGFFLGPGPDSDAMLAFAYDCSGHYFEPLNLLLRAPACTIGEPYLLQVLVWGIVALICSRILARDRKWAYIPSIMFVTITCTGNYRIALAALSWRTLHVLCACRSLLWHH